MVRRLSSAGHASVVHDKQPAAVGRSVKQDAMGVASLRGLVVRLSRPRVLWLMVPAAGVDLLLSELVPLLGGKAELATGDPDLGRYAGQVSDSGEGRWTLQAAIEEGVPVPVLSAALFERFSSGGGGDFADRVLSAMREEFGGHAEKSAA